MAPLCSIIIPTLGRDSLYPLVFELLKQRTAFSFDIVLLPQVPLKEELLQHPQVRLFYEPPGKGFAYYRNKGVEKSTGAILAFIDDDELPLNPDWLSTLTSPIREGHEAAVTAGYRIALGQGYLTDCGSLLGFPGGGAVGFETMWPLGGGVHTDHICTGNLALRRETLVDAGGFDPELRSGNEDVELGERLSRGGIRIRYLPEATVSHVARRGYLNFLRWNRLRGISAAGYLKNRDGRHKVTGRLSSSRRILAKVAAERPRYLPGVLFMMFSQYLAQTVGYLSAKGEQKEAPA